nr:diguanylate cyclase [Kineococcus aurantiacus]
MATVLNAATAALAWRQRARTPAARALAAATGSLALWSALTAPQLVRLPPAVHAVLAHASFAGILGSVVGLHLLFRLVADPHFQPGRAHRAHLVLVPTAILLAVATDPWHHLVFAAISPLPGPPWYDSRFGPLFWAHAGWCYLLLLAADVRLARAWLTGTSVLRAQAGTLLLAGAVPLAGNVVLTATHAFSGQDLTPLFFTATGVLAARAVLRGGLLRVVPVARGAVVDTIGDHIVVVDVGGTVVDVNPAGRAHLRLVRPHLPRDPVGLPASEFLGPRALGDLPGGQVHYALEYRPGVHLDVKVTAITDRRGRPLGRVVGRDVTDLVQTRRRLEELRAQLAEEAVRDPLTGLHNRRHLDPVAAGLVRGAGPDRPLAVLAVDVDHFKAVNDAHGHATGDDVLVAVAHALAATARTGDLVARTGGEEFVLVLPGADPAALARRAGDFHRACAAVRVTTPAGDVLSPTVSVGTAVTTDPAAAFAVVLARADGALYEAKATGRDRVVHAGDAEPAHPR